MLIKYYMTNLLNMKLVNHFICVSTITYTDLKIDASAKHIFALVSDKFWKKLVKKLEKSELAVDAICHRL